jgi:hypothetical protein
VKAVADAPAALSPIDAVAAALEAAGALIEERRQLARLRQRIIAANAELRERELIKLASLSAAIAGALRQRGVDEPSASLTAEAGIAVFRIAFQRWMDGAPARDLPRLIRESLLELRSVLAARSGCGSHGN